MLNEIIDWNKERNIPRRFDAVAEIGYLLEEMTELARANDNAEKADALCDMIVFCTGAMWKLGFDPEKCMAEVMKEINAREGGWDPVFGKWMKVKKENLYKADFSTCLMEEIDG